MEYNLIQHNKSYHIIKTILQCDGDKKAEDTEQGALDIPDEPNRFSSNQTLFFLSPALGATQRKYYFLSGATSHSWTSA